MKRLVVLLLLVMLAFVSKAQLPSSTFWSRQFNGNTKAQWVVLDSPMVNPVLDTFYARYPGTQIVRIQGGDTSFWFYGGNRRWFRGLQAPDTLALSNRIDLKLNITDTTNKWISVDRRLTDSVYRVNDSTVGLTINGLAHTFEILGRTSSGGGGSGTVTSVGLSMPSAFNVSGTPVTGSGVLSVTGGGSTAQYIRGNGTLATLDTGAIPDFYIKVRSLFSSISPIVYNNGSGAISILDATNVQKGVASFSAADFTVSSAAVSLADVVTSGSCTGCALNIDAKGRVVGYSTGSGSATNNTNIGAGFRPVLESTQEMRTYFSGFGTRLDSVSNADGLTWGADTARGSGLPTYHYIDSVTAESGIIQSIGTVNSQPLSLKGAVIDGDSLNFQYATTGYPGLLSSDTQTIDGTKTFTSATTNFQKYTPRTSANYTPTEFSPAALNVGKYDAWGITAIFPNGDRSIIYHEGTCHGCPGDIGVIKMKTSHDQGQTWADSSIIYEDAANGNDVLNIGGGVAPSGRLIIFFARFHRSSGTFTDQLVMHSDDQGVTWSNPITIPVGGNPIFSPYGGLVSFGGDTLALSWYSVNGSTWAVHFVKSTDNGNTWGSSATALTSATSQFTEPSFVNLGGSRVLGIVRNDNSNYYRQCFSSDGGATWSDQGDAQFDTAATKGPAWLSTYIGLSGRRVVVCYYARRTAPREVRAVYGYASSVAAGPSGWESSSRVTLGTFTGVSSGYQSVIHPYDEPYGFGWYYDELDANTTAIKFLSMAPAIIPLSQRFSGSVGVGAVTPEAKLHVSQGGGASFLSEVITAGTSSISSAINLRATSLGSATDGYGPAITFFMRDNSGSNNANAYIGVPRAGADNTGSMVFNTTTAGTSGERMRITNSGVGINVVVPEARLHVQQTSTPVILAELLNATTDTVSSALNLRNTTSGTMVNGFGVGATFYVKDNDGVSNKVGFVGSARSGTDSAASLVFITRNGPDSTFKEKMRITNNGALLINTKGGSINIDPRRLYVNGSFGISDDSTEYITSVTTQKVMLYDSITGKVQGILPTNLGVVPSFTGIAYNNGATLGAATIGDLLQLSGSTINFNSAYITSLPNNQLTLKSRMKRLSYVVGDADFSDLATRQEGLFELPDITANRTFTMFSGTAVDGVEFYIYNGNTTGNTWSFTGVGVVKATDGTPVTNLVNGVLYHIMGVYIGGTPRWIIVNQ